ncbi:prepilin-type N-terminal cleavage/methylation domain-containing protein [Marinicellulosiphila megalodicopiae]|uniref:prepilin-type N-terminal cleavage/methylation domain-containing protein n=1 Tax=Marinicellulosiphila megalodicopiae TaxID=2724896 RepID=UPI003BB19D26
MKNISLNKQSGFTLVEIAIVLVIIGLLLGGVLKGTELIENSKVKKGVNDMNSIAAAYNGYIDRYRAIPGDDGNLATIQARGGSWANVTQAGNRNGILTAAINDTFDGGGEHDNFWQHLKASGFITGEVGSQDTAALPRNAFGGLIGITTGVINGDLGGLKVCLNSVNGKAAMSLDNQMDDGNGATGSFRATLDAGGNAPTPPATTVLAAPYSEAVLYTVCMKI